MDMTQAQETKARTKAAELLQVATNFRAYLAGYVKHAEWDGPAHEELKRLDALLAEIRG